ncbi:CLUMA_CG014150, isoform A [Clunio marinus]|uniref:CLUMA_CG014150, isoform A n=1 Tax=Clunio marinus TaxID=568069 RepID=A0A1J1IMX6_9DIPT|nr:CLUMA_CG014150, isoform A [Clunio marinus]
MSSNQRKNRRKLTNFMDEDSASESFVSIQSEEEDTFAKETSVQRTSPRRPKSTTSFRKPQATIKPGKKTLPNPEKRFQSKRLSNLTESENEDEARLNYSRQSRRDQTKSSNVNRTKQTQRETIARHTRRRKNTPKRRTVIHEIVRLQKTVEPQIPMAPFARLVREFIQKHGGRQDYRITPEALVALREASESYLTNLFCDAIMITLNRHQVTLQPRDIRLLLFLRGPNQN